MEVKVQLEQLQSTQPDTSGQVLKLHLGCGPRVLKGWKNMDLNYQHYHHHLKHYTDKYYPEEMRGDSSDFLAMDLRTGLPFADNSVDVIFHEDFIEHIDQKSQVILLAEAWRVLKKGGVHRVNTPNLISSMRDYSDFTKGITGVYIGEWETHQHLNVLTPCLLQELALMVGYSKVLFNGRNQSLSPLVPLEYRPDPNDRPENGNIFADLVK